MTAEEFYQNFTDALKYIGADWGEKEAVEVWLEDGKFWLHYCGREARFPVTELGAVK